MEVQFLERKALFSFVVEGLDGSFSVDKSPLDFEKCRERFAKSFTEDLVGFYFKHPAGCSRNVAYFVTKTEEILGVESKSKFAETSRDTILWIEPSNFWKECEMKRSFFTIIVRAGITYDIEKDNYEDALFDQEYVLPTRKAVMRFLFGFTKYMGPSIATESSVQFKGWKSIFEGKSEEDIRSLLVWPKLDRFIPTLEPTLALWV